MPTFTRSTQFLQNSVASHEITHRFQRITYSCPVREEQNLSQSLLRGFLHDCQDDSFIFNINLHCPRPGRTFKPRYHNYVQTGESHISYRKIQIFIMICCKKSLLGVPRKNLKTFGERSFSNAATEVWNKLPEYIKSSQSTAIFKKNLKNLSVLL